MMKKRFFYSDNGTLTDYTEVINNYHSGVAVMSVAAAQCSIKIGSSLPFNHFYLKMGSVVNAELSEMTVKLWDNKEWVDVAEVIDGTEVDGKTCAQSGFIEFVPDKNEFWSIDDTQETNGTEEITGLGAVNVYDKYWLELTFSNNLTADLEMTWTGQIFANDDDLGDEYPDLVRSSMITAATGNSNWEAQHVRASKIITKDLKRKKIIVNKNQILHREDLMLPSVSKMAEMIYGMLGDDYNDDRLKAQKEYIYRLSTAFPVVDMDSNARESRGERVQLHGNFYR